MSTARTAVRGEPAILFRVADPKDPAYSSEVQELGGTVAFMPRPHYSPADRGTAHDGPFWALDLATGTAHFVPAGQSTVEEAIEGRPVRVRNDTTSLVVACEATNVTQLGPRPCWLCRGTGMRPARWHSGSEALVAPVVALHPFRIRTARTEAALTMRRYHATRDWEDACATLRANPGLPPHCDPRTHGCRDSGTTFQLRYADDGETGLLYCQDCRAVLVYWDSDWVVPADLAARFPAPSAPA